MADKEKEPVERVVILDPAESARRAAAEKLAAGDESPFKPVPPGGVYQSQDGRFHDAHGREVTEDGELVEGTGYEFPSPATAALGGPEVTDAERAGESDDEKAWRDDMKDQRRESMANPVEGAPMLGDTVLPPLEDDEKGGKAKRRTKSKE